MLKAKQTFNDGVVNIYSLGNSAEKGDMPKDGLTFKVNLRYRERTVGINRFWTAQQAQAKIDLLLRVQERRDITAKDVAIIGDLQYKIVQVQHIEDLPVMDLSLERLGEQYDVV